MPGNPNPSPDTRFGAPNGNQPGTTSEQRRLTIENAELAAKIKNEILKAKLKAVEDVRDNPPHPDDKKKKPAHEHGDASSLNLFKQVEDRAYGAPTQSHELTSPDGSMSSPALQIEFVKPDQDDKPKE